MFQTVVQLIISGILTGGVYALISIGLTLVFGVMKIINFAHGEFLMLGMYGAYWLFAMLGWNPYMSLILIIPASFLFGLLVEWTMIRRTIGRPHLVVVFVTLGLSIVLQNGAQFFWTADYRSVLTPMGDTILQIGPFRASLTLVVAFLVSVAITATLIPWLKYTSFGKALRATIQDRRTASLMGVNVPRMFTITFAIATMLVGVAGALIVPIYPTYPTVGLGFILIAYVVVVLGGMGSVTGALLGGIIIGLIESILGFFVSTSLTQLFYFLAFILILILRPSGLLGQRGTELVGAD